MTGVYLTGGLKLFARLFEGSLRLLRFCQPRVHLDVAVMFCEKFTQTTSSNPHLIVGRLHCLQQLLRLGDLRAVVTLLQRG